MNRTFTKQTICKSCGTTEVEQYEETSVDFRAAILHNDFHIQPRAVMLAHNCFTTCDNPDALTDLSDDAIQSIIDSWGTGECVDCSSARMFDETINELYHQAILNPVE